MPMIDFANKIQKHCADDLEPGEEVLAATFGQPPGAIRRQVALGAIGGAVGAVAGEALANRRLKNSDQTEGDEGMMLEIPKGKAVLGLSAQRLLVFGHSAMSGRPKGLNASIPLDQIQSIEVDQGKLAGKMLITFADGTSIDFDIVKTSGPGPFADKFTELTGR